MKRYLALWLPWVLLACSAGSGPDGAPRGGAGAGSGGATSSMPGSFSMECAKPELGKPVLRLLNRAQFTRTISDIFPQVSGAWIGTLPADPVSKYGFDNDAAAVVGPQLAQALLDTASAIASAVTGSALTAILPCSANAANRTCAEQFITQYGRRLFRRPLSTAERERYLAFYDHASSKSDFKTTLKWLTVGLIQSPNAIYRSELGSVESGARKLDAHELATELAYTYTGSTPSDSLLSQAETGKLDLPALAKTLLSTDAGQATLQNFFEGYLDYPRVASIERSNIPQWGAVRGQMIQETRSFIAQIVLKNGGGLKELLTSNTSNPTQALADYYGFPVPPSSDYASVVRGSGQGIGLLAQGSVLASRAQPSGSSPTQRGLLVFSRLLCSSKPNPPPNVPAIPSPVPGVVTTRQRYEAQHALNPPCSTCHQLFDPIGFGFEHFDEGGRYRETENGLTIDAASHVPTLASAPLFQFQGQEELARGLAEQGIVYQCFAAYLATFAFGTGGSCLGTSRLAEFGSGSLGIADYYAALAAEPHFSSRQSQ